jgi:hypothetical protein
MDSETWAESFLVHAKRNSDESREQSSILVPLGVVAERLAA